VSLRLRVIVLAEPAAPERARTPADRWIAGDKALHTGFSLVGTLLGGRWLCDRGMRDEDCPAWAGASVLCLGAFKELALDRSRSGGRASWRDFVADAVGVLGAWWIWNLMEES